jgi:hypothetical protein
MMVLILMVQSAYLCKHVVPSLLPFLQCNRACSFRATNSRAKKAKKKNYSSSLSL